MGNLLKKNIKKSWDIHIEKDPSIELSLEIDSVSKILARFS